ncbi:hypothetical protein TN98_12110 [Pantoea anthophila]|nr:hypothetical protein TN98_12110 [Pantoea anthophila]
MFVRCQLTRQECVHLFPQPFIYLLQALLQQHQLMPDEKQRRLLNLQESSLIIHIICDGMRCMLNV